MSSTGRAIIYGLVQIKKFAHKRFSDVQKKCSRLQRFFFVFVDVHNSF